MSWIHEDDFTAAIRFTAAFVGLTPRIDIVNLHGFSRKAVMLAALSRLFGKRFVLTLQTSVHDEPPAARDAGWASYWAYRSADLYLSVSPGISRGYLNAHLPASRLRQVCNAVETDRFRPALPGEREELRRELGLPPDLPLLLFVGFFSRDKRPDAMYRAWSEIAKRDTCSALVMVGATRAVHGEVDTTLAPMIRELAVRDGVADRLFLVESTTAIERYFRAADVYVLPSVREGLPIALLEALASGLPCVVHPHPVMQWMVGPGGRIADLSAPGNLSRVLCELSDAPQRRLLGELARIHCVSSFGRDKVLDQVRSYYRLVMADGGS